MRLMGHRRTFYFISIILLAASMLSLGVRGLNLGIDFTGGTLLERRFDQPVSTGEVRAFFRSSEALEGIDFGSPVIQTLGETNDLLIRAASLSTDEIGRVDEALRRQFGPVEVRRTENVDAVIGSELVRSALLALLLATSAILLYVAFRFQLTFGVAAVLALIHDSLIVLGAYSIVGMQINTPFVAGILTVVGYSINDTIVVFDRVRENRSRESKRKDLISLVDDSIIQTLPRTINTGLTTLLVAVPLFVFGGSTVREVTLALMVGIVVGTYSSIFVASSLWVSWMERSKSSGAAVTSILP